MKVAACILLIALAGFLAAPAPSYAAGVSCQQADVNHDGIVTIQDLALLAAWFLRSDEPKGYDLDGDGRVTVSDLALAAPRFGEVCVVATVSVLVSGSVGTTPPPGTYFSVIVTSSVSPGANRQLLLGVATWDDDAAAVAPTVSGNGLTWTQVDSQVIGLSDRRRVTVFKAIGAAPTAGAVTITFSGAQALGAYVLLEVTGSDNVDSVVQSAKATGGGSALAVTLAAFAQTSNATFAFWVTSTSLGSIAPGSGFTELFESSADGLGFEAEWKESNDTSVDATASEAVDWGGIAVEISLPPGGTDTNPPFDSGRIEKFPPPDVFRLPAEGIMKIPPPQLLRW